MLGQPTWALVVGALLAWLTLGTALAFPLAALMARRSRQHRPIAIRGELIDLAG